MSINCCVILMILLLAIGLYLYFRYFVPWIIKMIDFKTLQKRKPYWLIEAFLYFALIYPVITEVVGYLEGVKEFSLYEFLSDNKGYYGTVISIMLASISFIREDMNRKKEITAAINSMAKLKNDEEELKLNTCDKEKEQDQESK